VEQEFEGQVAVVTGAASGIGRAIAALFLRRGARVAILDVNEKGLAEAERSLEGGERLLCVRSDVSDTNALREARKRILGRFEQVDILVNNTGIYPYLSLSEMSAEEWDRVFAVNTRSAMLATQTFMSDMISRRYGRVVCIVTEDAYVAKPKLAHYAASKAAVASLVKSFALELAPHGVFVNGVSPGAVATERAKNMDWFAPRIAQIPCGYAAEPEDIAEVVLFLASRRNRYIVGETVVANGGTAMI
jgi:3-oxoacyl-[acyl-carrier protein] reductase